MTVKEQIDQLETLIVVLRGMPQDAEVVIDVFHMKTAHEQPRRWLSMRGPSIRVHEETKVRLQIGRD